MNPTARKQQGAYYTDRFVADFLVQWAIRAGTDRVLEPCFGGGVFVQAAADRITALGGDPVSTLVGVELNFDAHRRATETLPLDGYRIRAALTCADFFSIDPKQMGPFAAVVGTPPSSGTSASRARRGNKPCCVPRRRGPISRHSRAPGRLSSRMP